MVRQLRHLLGDSFDDPPIAMSDARHRSSRTGVQDSENSMRGDQNDPAVISHCHHLLTVDRHPE
jgi:hypothetical protein